MTFKDSNLEYSDFVKVKSLNTDTFTMTDFEFINTNFTNKYALFSSFYTATHNSNIRSIFRDMNIKNLDFNTNCYLKTSELILVNL